MAATTKPRSAVKGLAAHTERALIVQWLRKEARRHESVAKRIAKNKYVNAHETVLAAASLLQSSVMRMCADAIADGRHRP